MMRQDRFTEGAQEVLAASQELVRKERHSQWDVEHVLLALLTHGKGITPEIFDRLGVDAARLGDTVKAALDKSPKLSYDVVQIYTTPRIVRMLETANAEAPPVEKRLNRCDGAPRIVGRLSPNLAARSPLKSLPTAPFVRDPSLRTSRKYIGEGYPDLC